MRFKNLDTLHNSINLCNLHVTSVFVEVSIFCIGGKSEKIVVED